MLNITESISRAISIVSLLYNKLLLNITVSLNALIRFKYFYILYYVKYNRRISLTKHFHLFIILVNFNEIALVVSFFIVSL